MIGALPLTHFMSLTSFCNPWKHQEIRVFRGYNEGSVARNGFPGNIYLYKGNNRNTRKRCEICSKLIIKTSGVFIINFEQLTPFSSVSIVDFEQINVSRVNELTYLIPVFYKSLSKDITKQFFSQFFNPLMPVGNKKVTHT